MSFFTEHPEGGGRYDGRVRWGRVVSVAVAIVFVPMVLWLAGGPQYRLWKAGIERQIQVKDAESRKRAATFLAGAEVERSKGVAEANEIIAKSITPEYLRYHYINTLGSNTGRIIYIPTEGGLPILEAGRATQVSP